jgi:SMI1 / KNR4 family (SUKH-1)
MSILDAIEKARKEPSYVGTDDPIPESPYVCKVFEPIPWDRHALEQSLGFELPPELTELWDACGGMLLYGDDLWLPWGLLVCSPTETGFVKQNNRYQKVWREWVLFGDLVFATLQDAGEPTLIRCDKNADDYGSIVVIAQMDERSGWYKAASSLEEFLIRFMDAHGDKYWE